MENRERYAQATRSRDVRGRLRVCASDQGLFIAARCNGRSRGYGVSKRSDPRRNSYVGVGFLRLSCRS